MGDTLIERNKPSSTMIDKNRQSSTNIDNYKQNIQNRQNIQNENDYKALHQVILDWYPYHTGWFDADVVDRQFVIKTTKGKQNRWIILERLVKDKKLEKHNGKYRLIDDKIEFIDWLNADPNDTLTIKFPRGKDGSGFSFDGDIIIYPRDLIVIAGESNKGKTTLALNLVMENMDVHKVRLMGNEYEPHKFAARMKKFDWYPLLNEDGQPKFEVIRRLENHKDIIEPDSINVIDWINLSGDFWQIGKIMEDIQERLHRGIAIVVIQKSEGKDTGRGGDFSKDLSSVYFSISDGLLKVIKVKSYQEHKPNPNGKIYKFDIVDSGSRFSGICEVRICRSCNGKGQDWKHKDCDSCLGRGFHVVGD